MSQQIQRHVSLKKYTTLGVGGETEYFVPVATPSELEEAVLFARSENLLIAILGSGSNVLVDDAGFSGLVILLESKGISFTLTNDSVLVTAQAGELLDDVVSYCSTKGWWGIENLSHIPGTIGATPIQNVGAYGVEIKDVIETVKVFNTQTHTYEVFKNEMCNFGYRDSFFKTQDGKKYIVTEVTLRLSLIANPKITYRDLQQLFANTTPTVQEIREAIITIRSKKFPNWKEVGTAGSFFKNPTVSIEKYKELTVAFPDLPGFKGEDDMVKISLGWILDKVLFLKGFRSGNVATYTEQALVLIADSSATAQEVIAFANSIVAEIKNKIDVSVEWEVTVLK